ncbi:hypothetical protein LBWT_13030 [Leptolyngbya boryana IAM M-101]|nr:hypothetical protein LBWT_13030 [Leptolyngbya boryana IAM M-101]BAS61745.1 hypothetical protein LBDG_13030 [Leptolyngbya boryana dg5]
MSPGLGAGRGLLDLTGSDGGLGLLSGNAGLEGCGFEEFGGFGSEAFLVVVGELLGAVGFVSGLEEPDVGFEEFDLGRVVGLRFARGEFKDELLAAGR